ncbi:uncharacterized protein BDZ83DRAFT_613871 [Colletotrichum acutatum]|uniref:Uncharacterized protein n=1 Tax=Glomerella acutata TaxID=27357 RepID=A0AAD8XJR5_GLOAC|nr:uncharacterized protein BDZ83DRAFT_613871 [Colletotrichum acutatum]KAK1727260.1 hypothetical protein BDZ83DRAFT_613871 [Colletotrichum acutatum]
MGCASGVYLLPVPVGDMWAMKTNLRLSPCCCCCEAGNISASASRRSTGCLHQCLHSHSSKRSESSSYPVYAEAHSGLVILYQPLSQDELPFMYLDVK